MSRASNYMNIAILIVVLLGLGFALSAVFIGLFGSYSLKLRFSELIYTPNYSLRGTEYTADGVIVAERIGQRQGGELGRVSFVDAATGTLHQELFNREQEISGVTGDLVWINGTRGRHSLRLPDLAVAMTQEELFVSARVDVVHSRVDSASGRFVITGPDGLERSLDPSTLVQESGVAPVPTRMAGPSGFHVNAAGQRSSFAWNETEIEGLLDLQIARDTRNNGAVLDVATGAVLLIHRRTIRSRDDLLITSVGPMGTRWESRPLGVDECALFEADKVAIVQSTLVIVGLTKDGNNPRICVVGIDPATGQSRWSSRL